MKGLNSRFSHAPAKRFSNTAHIMGGMVTDADLTEAGQIHQDRDEATNAVTVWSGVPDQDGAVALTTEGAKLRPGWIVAQGKQGQLTTTLEAYAVDGLDENLSGIGALDLYEHQVDLPFGPALPEGRVLYYADLWERPVFASEDADLTDAGLHGAETSYRTRTMVQIKALPLGDEEDLENALAQLDLGLGNFARKGTARVRLEAKSKDIAVDDCDPCADQITVEQTLPNALWRVEVIRVDRDADGLPQEVQLAWSMENAQAIAKVDITSDSAARQSFGEDGAYVFEFFSDATEAQIGRFAAPYAAKRPHFTTALTAIPDPDEGAGEGHAFTHIRRWDGCAVADLDSRTVSQENGTGRLLFEDGTLKLVTDFFDLDFDTGEREILAGDYWLVEVRRYAAEDDRLLLVGEEDGSAAPYGITHHFCPLFAAVGDAPVALSDAETRRLSFPALSNLPASHVAYSGCDHLYGDSENVKEALDALCDLSADQIGFTPPDDCPRFEGATTVAEAFEKLCRIEDNTSLTHLLYTMMDWGVVCGMRMGLSRDDKGVITWSGGTILDPAGRLIEVPAGEASINEMPSDNMIGDLAEIQQKNGEICLSVAVDEGGHLELFLSDRDTAFANVQPTFDELVTACVAGKKTLDVGGITRALKDTEAKVLTDMVAVWRDRKTFTGSVPMSSNEQVLANGINEALLAELDKISPDQGQKVRTVWSELEQEINPGGVAGAARSMRRMQLESSKMAAVANAQDDYLKDCECLHALPACPTKDGTALPLVPVACVELETFTPGNIIFADLCELCCRKQSMNWRSYRYYFGDVLSDVLATRKEQCCDSPPPDTGGWWDWVGDISDYYENKLPDYVHPPVEVEPDEVPPHWLWPPRKVPDVPDLVWGRDPDLGGKYPGTGRGPGGGVLTYPEIADLGVREAQDLLTGNGYDVVETIAIDEENPFERMGKYSPDGVMTPTLTRSARPGDKVVLLEQGGKAFSYVAVAEGDGLLPFTQTADLIKIDEKIEEAVGKLDLSTFGLDGGAKQADLDSLEVELARVAGLAEAGGAGDGLSQSQVDGLIQTAIDGLDVTNLVASVVHARFEALDVNGLIDDAIEGINFPAAGLGEGAINDLIQGAIEGIDFEAKVRAFETDGPTAADLAALSARIDEVDSVASALDGGVSISDINGLIQGAIADLDISGVVQAQVTASFAQQDLTGTINAQVNAALAGLDLNTAVRNEMTLLIEAGEAGGGIDLPTAEVDALVAQVAALNETKTTLEADLAELTSTQQTVSNSIADMTAELVTLNQSRQAAVAAVAQAQNDLAALLQSRDETLSAIAQAQTEMNAVKDAQADFVRDMRGDQPLEMTVTDDEALSALKSMGFVSVKDLAEANATELKSALREFSLDAASLQSAAVSFINK